MRFPILPLACLVVLAPPAVAQPSPECVDGRMVVSGDEASATLPEGCPNVIVSGDGASLTFGAVGTLALDGDDASVTVSSPSEAVTVSGDGSSLTLDTVDLLTLDGDDNSVTVAGVREVRADGDGNVVNHGGAAPTLSGDGADTRLVATSLAAAPARSDPGSPRVDAGTAAPAVAAPAPAGGIAADEIADLLFMGELRNFKIFVLLRDGTMRISPDTPVTRLDRAADRAEYPDEWHLYRRAGDAIELKYTDRGDWTPAFDATPERVRLPADGMTMDGLYRHAQPDPYGNGASFASFAFTADGRFEWSSSSILGYGGAAAASSCDRTGDRSIATGTAAGGTGYSSGSGNRCGNANTGRYVVENGALTLHADDGQTWYRPMYVMEQGTLVIGPRWFARQ